MLDDVAVVVQPQSLHVHGLVEGPGVGSVFLGEHLLDDPAAVLQLLRDLGALLHQVLLGVWNILLWRLHGPAALPARAQLGGLGLSGQR